MASSNQPAPEVQTATTAAAHHVLKDDMPQPPGTLERRKRRVAKERRKGPFVKYVGQASHRAIRPHEWASLNIELKDKNATHLWSVKNDYMIESKEFSDAQLDYLLIDDVRNGAHCFLEVDYNKKGQIVQVTQADDE